MNIFCTVILILILNIFPLLSQWEQVCVGLPIDSIRTTASKGSNVLIGHKSGISVSNNNAGSWVTTNSFPPDLLIHDLQFIGDVLIAGTDSSIYNTTDFGISWERIYFPIGHKTCYSLEEDNDVLYAGSEEGILISTNYKSNWETLKHVKGPINTIAVKGSYIVAGREQPDGGSVMISNNGGGIWLEKYINVNRPNIYSIEFHNNYVFAGTIAGLFKSLDFGNTWIPSYAFPSIKPVKAMIVYNNFMFAGTEGDGIFYTRDFGNTWNSLNNGIEGDSISVNSFTLSDEYLFTAVNSCIYRYNLAVLVATGVEQNIPDTQYLSVIPNPATDFITIQSTDQKLNDLVQTVQIFDILGVDVSPAGGGVSGADGGGFKIDISHLPAGVYFIRIGDKVERLIKI